MGELFHSNKGDRLLCKCGEKFNVLACFPYQSENPLRTLRSHSAQPGGELQAHFNQTFRPPTPLSWKLVKPRQLFAAARQA